MCSVCDWLLPWLIMSFKPVPFVRDFSIVIHLIGHAIACMLNSSFKCSSPLRQLRVIIYISIILLLPIGSRIEHWAPSVRNALESLTSWINFRSDVFRIVVTDGCRYILSWPLVFLKEANFRIEGNRSRISSCTRSFQVTGFGQNATREVLVFDS